MIIKNMKKILSSIVIAAYLMVYTAPLGMCITVAKINTGVQKPVLRAAVKNAPLKLEGDISISKKNPKISLSVRDSDVKQVLRMFADKAGLNIIFHSSVDTVDSGTEDNTQNATSPSAVPGMSPTNPIGPSLSNSPPEQNDSQKPSNNAARKVTLDLVNVPLNDAFRMVLQVSGLTYYIDNNTMVVTSANAAKKLNLAKQELAVIPVKYIDAATLATFLNKNIFSINKPGLSNAQIAVTNPSTNEILIFGTKNDYLMAKKVIAQFDIKPLEETFIVNHTTPKEMATLLCKVLFKTNESSGSDSGSSDNSSNGSTTGGASPADSGGSMGSTDSSSSDSSSSDSGSVSAISLGAGVIACQQNNKISNNSLSSLNTTNLSVTYFAQRGTISVMGGSAQQMERIKDFIAENDKKQPQAYLEVSIIELNESGSRAFNNTWDVYSSFFSGSFNGTTSNSVYPILLGSKGYTVDDGSSESRTNFSHITGSPSIKYTMNYILENKKGRVLANPRIMITNGQTSKIDLSSDYVKSVTSQIIPGSITNQTSRTYTIGTDDGIVVEIVAFISPDGYVTLNIKPQYSTVKDKVWTPTSDGKGVSTDLAATLLQRRNLDLKNIRIKDGETLVIGGMIREDEQKNVSKFPVLGDLPGIGMFFRNTNTEKTKQELVIMLTPKIIKESEDIVNKPSVTL